MIRKYTSYFLVCLLFFGLVHPCFSDDEAVDQELRGLWNGMKAAMAAQDIDKAVSYFSYETRGHYRELYTALADHLPELARDMGDIEPVVIEQRTAKYRLIRKEVIKGETYDIIYYVYFILESDGVWRIFRY